MTSYQCANSVISIKHNGGGDMFQTRGTANDVTLSQVLLHGTIQVNMSDNHCRQLMLVVVE